MRREKKRGQSLYKRGEGCGRRRQGEGPVTAETASIDLARLAGEPLTVGKEESLGEPGKTSCDDSKLTRGRMEGRRDQKWKDVVKERKQERKSWKEPRRREKSIFFFKLRWCRATNKQGCKRGGA